MIKKLHNGTLKTVTNIKVPKKWKKFEYLESTGTQWIDTGLIGTSNMRIELTFMSGSAVDRMFGAGPPGDNAVYLMANYDGASTLGIRYFGIATNIPYTINTKCHIIITNSELIKDGVQQITLNKTGSTVNTLTLFMYNYSPISTNTKIYEYKVYDGPTLIQHFIPCEYNGQYGMWDLVENKFYGNKGTGTFKVGPEVPNYDEIEYIKRPNHLLPNGVELYDCLECDGIGTYIDTEFKPDINSGFEIKCMYTEKCNADLFGAGGTYNTGFGLHTHGSTTAGFTNGVDLVDLSSGTLYSYNTYKYFNKIAYLNGTALTLKANAITPTVSENICIGKAYRTKYQPIAVQFLKLYQETTLVRNFLPCTYFGEPGMWDTVTNKFYGNSGTGQFKLGNKLTDVLARTSDGQLLTDNKIYIEPDGSKWIRIFHHNNPTSYKFSSDNTFNTKVYIDENRWFDCSILNTIKGPYEFIAEQTPTSGASKQRFRFIQKTNPYISTFNNTKAANITKINTGYASLKDSYGGLYYNNMSYSFFVQNNSRNGNWWGAVGSWKEYSGGIPGYNENVCTTGYMDLYLRVDELLGGNVNIYEKKNALVRTSTAYINTGVVANNNTKLVAEIQYTTLANNGRFGSYGSDGRFYFGTMENQWVAAYGSEGSYNHSLGAADTNKHLFELNAEGFFIDGIKKYTSSPKNFTSKIELNCQVLQNGTGSYKIYWFKIYKDNTLVRDFIPATLGGKPGLYDKVEHKMYYNANSTGQFTVE